MHLKTKFLYYFSHLIIFSFFVFLSVFLYFRRWKPFLNFIKARYGNLVFIAVSILVLSYIFDLISSSKIKETHLNAKTFYSLAIKSLGIVVITSFLEFLIFYPAKVGRIIHLEIWLFLTLFFMLKKSLSLNKSQKKKAIGWFSKLSPYKVYRNYNIPELKENSVITSPYETENLSFIVYDYYLEDKEQVYDIIKGIVFGIPSKDLVSFIEERTGRIPLDYVNENWLLQNLHSGSKIYLKVKTLIEFSLALIFLPLLFPVGFIFAIAHCIESKGPIFYTQERLGFLGRKFKLIKFRTMIPKAEKEGPRFASENDSRITKIGRIMRKFRIDEIPQLINVLKGELSLIGPRPEREVFVKELAKKLPFYNLRLLVKPGITGWAQVNYKYAGESMEDHKRKLEYDLFYIKNRDLILDMIIILKTAKIMLKAIGS